MQTDRNGAVSRNGLCEGDLAKPFTKTLHQGRLRRRSVRALRESDAIRDGVKLPEDTPRRRCVKPLKEKGMRQRAPRNSKASQIPLREHCVKDPEGALRRRTRSRFGSRPAKALREGASGRRFVKPLVKVSKSDGVMKTVFC